jgi:[ribosomal protein S5]-alanine N-acetyltransferase
MKVIFETAHLVAREITVDDAPFLFELMNTEGWLKFIGNRNIKTIEDAKNHMQQNYIPMYDRLGYGLWLIAAKDTGIAMGMCGILKRDSLPYADIGFAFLPLNIGKGIAWEAASHCVDWFVQHYPQQPLLAIVQDDNIASIKLLEKLAFELDGIHLSEEDVPLKRFRRS